MHEYSFADVERLIGLSRGMVRAMIRQRFVAPHRGRRREYRFSFQDLIVLRTAKALSNTRLSARRITRSLRELRQHLPEEAPLAGLSLRAVGEAVSVREGQAEWDSNTGQYLLALDVVVRNGDVHIVERTQPATDGQPRAAAAAAAAGDADAEAEALFAQALEIDATEPEAAIELYRRCLALDPRHAGAQINCARLLQEGGALEEAERMYRSDGTRDTHALYNLGVLLEDTGRPDEAIESYLAVIALDPAFAEAHYNLARLYEIQGNTPHMIRHLRQYRSLTSAARS
ncbi:MAG: tetratricopeptide repeat protein [Steroidobacteraceae bacterium]